MNRLAPYLQAAPLALVFLLFFILPIGLVVVVSFLTMSRRSGCSIPSSR